MFVRKRSTPIPLQKMDAAIPRLHHNHTKLNDLRREAAKSQRGFNGERRQDYHLKMLTTPFLVVSDVTLRIFGKKFQTDSLIVSDHAIYIVEVKSINGTVTFHTPLKQFIQEDGEKLSGIKYPITQAESNQYQLMRWLQMHNLEGLPIYYFIAFAETSTILKVIGDEEAIKKVVSYVEEIPLRIIKQNHYLEKQTTGNRKLKERIVHVVLQHCEDFDMDILQKLNIPKQDLLPGVQCPHCYKLGMIYKNCKWHCYHCHAQSKHAHKKALQDFHLLYQTPITNKQCRWFLQIHCRHLAKRLLKGSNYILKKGTQKWYYHKQETKQNHLQK